MAPPCTAPAPPSGPPSDSYARRAGRRPSAVSAGSKPCRGEESDRHGDGQAGPSGVGRAVRLSRCFSPIWVATPVRVVISRVASRHGDGRRGVTARAWRACVASSTYTSMWWRGVAHNNGGGANFLQAALRSLRERRCGAEEKKCSFALVSGKTTTCLEGEETLSRSGYGKCVILCVRFALSKGKKKYCFPSRTQCLGSEGRRCPLGSRYSRRSPSRLVSGGGRTCHNARPADPK